MVARAPKVARGALASGARHGKLRKKENGWLLSYLAAIILWQEFV